MRAPGLPAAGIAAQSCRPRALTRRGAGVLRHALSRSNAVGARTSRPLRPSAHRDGALCQALALVTEPSRENHWRACRFRPPYDVSRLEAGAPSTALFRLRIVRQPVVLPGSCATLAHLKSAPKSFPSAQKPFLSTQKSLPSTRPPAPSTRPAFPSARESLPSTQPWVPSAQEPFLSTHGPLLMAREPFPSTRAPRPSTRKSSPSTDAAVGGTHPPRVWLDAPSQPASGQARRSWKLCALACLPGFPRGRGKQHPRAGALPGARRGLCQVGRVCPQRAAGPCKRPGGAGRTPRPTKPPPPVAADVRRRNRRTISGIRLRTSAATPGARHLCRFNVGRQRGCERGVTFGR